MPTPFWAALASLLALVLWLTTRRQPRALLRSTDTSAVAALNRAQLVHRAEANVEPPPADSAALAGATPAAAAQQAAEALPPIPRTPVERRAYLRQLRLWAAGDSDQRLRALRSARQWSHPSLLPLLRRGLRDSDPRVMAAAAAAIAPYRGRSVSAQPAVAALPRRVSRTR